uniref:Uncharacterized protein n=1 Tax=Glossina morsitans morsitans TaxID=37546 RepID=A0A1B0G0V1_GLOMM
MSSLTWLFLIFLIFFVGTTSAGTHVNISISEDQHGHSTGDQYLVANKQKSAKFKTNSMIGELRDDCDDRRISNQMQIENQNPKTYAPKEYSARLQSAPNQTAQHATSAPTYLPRFPSRTSPASVGHHTKNNVEFEYFMQNHYRKPTVNTVYESNEATPRRTSQDTGVLQSEVAMGNRKMVQFERQQALPGSEVNQEDDQNVDEQPIQESEALTEEDEAVDNETNDGDPYSPGSDTVDNPISETSSNEDESYFNNSPAPVSENDASVYEDSAANYMSPAHERPMVTKTIQIAQPAIKAKTFEVHLPAIQKEFYDIEERVVIKPAGTIVVELERPIAKIPKGETILPLGHPHPAVAGAYQPDGKTRASSNVIYSSAGSPSSASNHHQHVATHERQIVKSSTPGSSIAVAPSYPDQNSKKQAIDNSFRKSSHAVSSQLRVIGSKSNTAVNRLQAPSATKPSTIGRLTNAPENSVLPEQQSSDGDGIFFEAEYIDEEEINSAKGPKPARVQEAYTQKMAAVKEQQPIIKHEHNIHLAPSQHNIYLTRKMESSQVKFMQPKANMEEYEEPAHVQEVKAQLYKTKRPVVVYASGEQEPVYQEKVHQPVDQRSHVESQQDYGKLSRVQYSTPYAKMRYHPEDKQYYPQVKKTDDPNNYNENAVSPGPLAPDERMQASKGEKNQKPYAPDGGEMSQTRIAITIPSHNVTPKEKSKPIFISSTVRPKTYESREDAPDLKISISHEPNPKEFNHNENNFSNHTRYSERNHSNSNHAHKERLAHLKLETDCVQEHKKVNTGQSEYNLQKSSQLQKKNPNEQQKFMRLVERPRPVGQVRKTANYEESHDENAAAHPPNVDIFPKSTNGHVAAGKGSRVIAATPAPKDPSLASESFHTRRIVVNHPFQTVREIVEHEPYTNYHEVQIQEPATPEFFQSADYFQPSGALRQSHSPSSTTRSVPMYYH